MKTKICSPEHRGTVSDGGVGSGVGLSRIYWCARAIDASGHGEPIPDVLAQAWLSYLKAKYPEIGHSVMGERPPEGPNGSHSNP